MLEWQWGSKSGGTEFSGNNFLCSGDKEGGKWLEATSTVFNVF